jgi:hypothetical protein
MIGQRLFHAAGYNVPGAFDFDLGPGDLQLDPKATFKLYGVQKRPLTRARVESQLTGVARLPDGKLRVVAVPWVPGRVLGSLDMLGRRPGDPNDRIPHEHRRSLRASLILFAWINEVDPSSINTLDTYVEKDGRHFVRHYIFDFGATLGSATDETQAPQDGGMHLIEVGRTLGAIAALGFYQRPMQKHRDEWEALTSRYPSAGYYAAESFDPDAYRPNRKLPGHVRMTDRDAYWGAKLVTSFSDAQIAAIVATARYPEADAAYIAHALRVRRDIIGRRYLRRVAAVENPALSPDGTTVCFDDLAIARGYASPGEVRYHAEISDGLGRVLGVAEAPATGPRACLPVGGPGPGSGYRVVRVSTQLPKSKTASIHLRWRESEGRFAVVGLDREE